MRYKNTVTGEVIEVDASITGGFWEEIVADDPDEEVVETDLDEEAAEEMTAKKEKARGESSGKKA